MSGVRRGALAAAVLLAAGVESTASARGVKALPSGSTCATAAAGPRLTVDATSRRHAIDPHIYGMNFAEESLARELRLPVRRWGGNDRTRYNYKLDAYNHGADWYFENNFYSNGTTNLPDGSEADKFIEQNRRTGTDTLLTLPLIGWTTAARNEACGFGITKYGPQQDSDPWRPDCGNGVRDDHIPVTGNDPLDTSTAIGPAFTKGWVQYLDSAYGTADSGGVRFYDLDNEPDLWHETHRDVHPAGAGYDELRDRTFATAATVKDADPGSQTLGPVGSGFLSLTHSGLDQQICNREDGDCWSNPPERAKHGGLPFTAWYLQQMQIYERAHNRRILDYFDVHIYPQQPGLFAGEQDSDIPALRLRSTRQLWDPAYVDESWIGQPVQFIPRMRSLVRQYYPGTKLAISEYNWGALDRIDGALAQADVLGIFGREGLDLATLWSPPNATDPGFLKRTDPVAHAFRMFRNYDGHGHAFGDTAVHATSEDQSRLAVYAAEGSSDQTITVIVINKTTGDLTSRVSVAGTSATSAQTYRYDQTDLSSIRHPADQALTHGDFTTTFPAQSITLYALSA